MRTNNTLALSLSILAVAVLLSPAALWSQEAATVPASCTMAGQWYGGSPGVWYLLTITPHPGGEYTMIGAAAFSQASLGYPITTIFSNSIVKVRGNTYEFFGVGMVNTSDGFPAPNPELWAVHGTARLTGCGTLQLDYDFFGAYYMPSDKKPFLDAPDYFLEPPPPFSETYQRMPTRCKQCAKQ